MKNNRPTNYTIANDFITDYTQRIVDLLGDNLIGIYLFGSLTYGDFNPQSSDIDFMVLVNNPLTTSEIKQIEALHKELENGHPKWKDRVESSYTPVSMLGQVLPPKDPRPYYGEGKMWHEANYGNEWIINLYLLEKYGLTLSGTDIHKLVDEIDIVEVQKACIRDLFQEWEPKLREPEWLDNSHYQSYLVLNLCRILHAVVKADPRSKKVSAQWVRDTYPQWTQLIRTAEDWFYGIEMKMQSKTLDFLRFVIDLVKNHGLWVENNTSQLPNGTRLEGLVIKDGKILVIERQNNSEKYYVLPGGGWEPPESFEFGVAREVIEETSIKVEVERPVFDLVVKGDSRKLIYLCSYLEGEPILGDYNEKSAMMKNPDDIYIPRWLSIEDLPRATLYTLEFRDWFVKNYNNGKLPLETETREVTIDEFRQK